jgi:hypothetical protein
MKCEMYEREKRMKEDLEELNDKSLSNSSSFSKGDKENKLIKKKQ